MLLGILRPGTASLLCVTWGLSFPICKMGRPISLGYRKEWKGCEKGLTQMINNGSHAARCSQLCELTPPGSKLFLRRKQKERVSHTEPSGM